MTLPQSPYSLSRILLLYETCPGIENAMIATMVLLIDVTDSVVVAAVDPHLKVKLKSIRRQILFSNKHNNDERIFNDAIMQ